MLKHPDHVRFGEKHFARDALAVLIAACVDVVNLDRDIAAVIRIVRQIHDTGAAAAHLVDDHVLADFLRQWGARILYFCVTGGAAVAQGLPCAIARRQENDDQDTGAASGIL